MIFSPAHIRAFRRTVLGHYRRHGRDLPWRRTVDPYRILVSEIMLQQTQVSRVLGKYREFLKTFPTIRSLARATTPDLLRTWSGLGYNRRALNLRRAAQIVVERHRGRLPSDEQELEALPGIGPATAGLIRAFAFNLATVIVNETNIETVFIHHFFVGRKAVSRREIEPLARAALDRSNPRRWYWALMDYGTFLKRTHGNASRRSRTYKRQSRFEGSTRQVRGRIVKLLAESSPLTLTELVSRVSADRPAIQSVLSALGREGFIHLRERKYSLA